MLRGLASRVGVNLPAGALSVTAVSEWTTDDKRFIDVVAVVRASWSDAPCFVLGIEGKFGAIESAAQLSDYQAALQAAYPMVPKMLLFATVDGTSPATHDDRLETCQVKPLRWSIVADVASSLAPSSLAPSPFTQEFATYIRSRYYRNPDSAKAALLAFVEEELIPSVRCLTSSPVHLVWVWPTNRPATEIVLEFDGMNPAPNNKDSPQVWYMLYAKNGFNIGCHVDLCVSARCDSQAALQAFEQLQVTLAGKLPPREGRNTTWMPWRALWGGGCRTLTDLKADDAKALSRLVARAHMLTGNQIRQATKEVWQQR
jgi:hypothetical protein